MFNPFPGITKICLICKEIPILKEHEICKYCKTALELKATLKRAKEFDTSKLPTPTMYSDFEKGVGR